MIDKSHLALGFEKLIATIHYLIYNSVWISDPKNELTTAISTKATTKMKTINSTGTLTKFDLKTAIPVRE